MYYYSLQIKNGIKKKGVQYVAAEQPFLHHSQFQNRGNSKTVDNKSHYIYVNLVTQLLELMQW
jgi:hypothetical protein